MFNQVGSSDESFGKVCFMKHDRGARPCHTTGFAYPFFIDLHNYFPSVYNTKLVVPSKLKVITFQHHTNSISI